jgi:hypothetical protein
MNIYDVGDVARIAAAFTTAAGAATDPATVTFKYRSPTGSSASLVYGVDVSVVKDSTGNYHLDITLNAAGDWAYRVVSTGSGAAASEGKLRVADSEFD